MTPLIGEALALDLVNTRVHDPRAGEIDLIAAEDDLRCWLEAQSRRDPAYADLPAVGVDATQVTALRASLDAFFDAVMAGRRPPSRSLRHLTDVALAAPEIATPAWDAEQVVVRRTRSGPATQQWLAAIADSVADLVDRGDLARLRVCAGERCRLRFAARHRRRWCSPETCGNRARVARHYQRQRATTPG